MTRRALPLAAVLILTSGAACDSSGLDDDATVVRTAPTTTTTSTTSTTTTTAPAPPTTQTTRPVVSKPSRSSVPPRVVSRTAPRGGAGTTYHSQLLDKLAQCESGMNRYAHSPGGRYHSYYQWSVPTWRAVSGLPGHPEDYDYATQKAAAAKIPLSSWSRQFPGCSKRLGVA